MSNFSDKPWGARYAAMGDASEQKFEESVDGKCERFGLNRPEGVHVPTLPERVRSAPDYIQTSPLRFVECKGLGRAQKLSVKLATLGSLHWWNGLMPVDVFVWDSHRKRSCTIPLVDLDRLIQTPDLCTITYFDERKIVFQVPADDIFLAAAASN